MGDIMHYTIITGATSGIGKELAFIYAKNGHHLILIARRYKHLVEIKNEIQTIYSVCVECFKCDLNDLPQVEAIFAEINNSYSINCLINNAGNALFEGIGKVTRDSLVTQTNINFLAPVLITKTLISQLKVNNGSIINICSILSYIPNAKSSIYVANKHALYGFSNTIRIEYPMIHVLTIHPKTVKTNFFQDKNYLKKAKNALDANIVARKIFKSHQNKKRKLNIPRKITLLIIIYQFIPNFIDWINIRFFSNK